MSRIIFFVTLAAFILASVSAVEEEEKEDTAVTARGDNWFKRFFSGNFWKWDRDTVKTGLFLNENIMIGVGQGLFNFIFSTLAWFTVSQIYSATAAVNPSVPRAMRALSIGEAAEEVLDAMIKFESRY